MRYQKHEDLGEHCVRVAIQCSAVGNQPVEKPEMEMNLTCLKNRRAVSITRE